MSDADSLTGRRGMARRYFGRGASKLGKQITQPIISKEAQIPLYVVKTRPILYRNIQHGLFEGDAVDGDYMARRVILQVIPQRR